MNQRYLGTGTLLGVLAAFTLGAGAFACSGDGGSGSAGHGGFGGTGGNGGGTAGSGGTAGTGGGTAGSGGTGGSEDPCTGVRCLVPEGETCVAGKCTCTEGSCPMSFVCNDDKLCETTGCADPCTAGEICIKDVRNNSFKCRCNPTEDRCTEGGAFQCDPKTQRCVVDTPCDPECTTGETCNPVTKVCECGPGTCNQGFSCLAGKCVITPAEEGENCVPGLPDNSPAFDCVPQSGGRNIWLRECVVSGDCNDPQRFCAKLTDKSYCVPNLCDKGVVGQDGPLNGTNFGGCDADDGEWTKGDPSTGTCLPFPAQGGSTVSICVRKGTAKMDQACAFVPRGSQPSRTCDYGMWCAGTGNIEGCIEDGDCSTGQKCVSGACRDPCDSMGRCFLPYSCVQGACVEKCKNDGECPGGSTCSSGQCVPRTCTGDVGCSGNSYCTDDGICSPTGTCEDACNAGSAGTGQNDAGCEDPAGECQAPNGGTGGPVVLGYCRASCLLFESPPPATPPCPAFGGVNRYCRPLKFDGTNPEVPGVCAAQVNTPTEMGKQCTPKDNPNQPNACEDGTLCVGDAPSRCYKLCWCGGQFKPDGTCDTQAPQCPAGLLTCKGNTGDTVGFCTQ